MPLPLLPPFKPDDSPSETAQRLMDYMGRMRGELEGAEGGVPNAIEVGHLWGMFPPGAVNLIVDPSFELNRGAWGLPIGAMVLEDSANARSGNYVAVMDSAHGYAGGLLVPNNHYLTPCLPSQVMFAGGLVIAQSGATGNANVSLVWVGADHQVISTDTGTNVAIGGTWQFASVKAIAPAGTVYCQAQYRISSLSGRAAWDDMELFVLHQQVETATLDTVTNFSSTAETFLLSVGIGPLVQTPGALGILSPVIVLATCTYFAVPGSGDHCTFRLRRGSITGPILNTVPGVIGSPSPLAIMGFDESPTVGGEVWMLTAQMGASTGGTTAFHRMTASQVYR